MTQQEVIDTTADTHVPERLPQRPVETKAIIMHDTGDEYFSSYVNNCYRKAVLNKYVELEVQRDNPRQDRVAKANTKLMELKND